MDLMPFIFPFLLGIGIYTISMFCVKLKSMLFNFNISRLDQRLVKRYNNLVQLNMNPLASLAPAIKDIASAQKNSFATTQAVWRFLNNDKISFKQ